MKRDKNRKLYLYIGIISLSLFAVWALLVVTGKVAVFDDWVGTIFVRTEAMTKVMKCVTFLGDATTLITIGVAVLIIGSKKIYGLFGLLNLGLIALVNNGLKFIFRRPRPLIEHLVVETGFSFPSGHSSSAMAFYGFLIYLTIKNCSNKFAKWGIVVALSLVILGIGMSRIYLGVHYPSDVVGSFIYTVGYLLFFIKLFEKALIKRD